LNVVNGKHPLLTREPTDTAPVMAIFGGTTEIQKQIIARGLGR
jgi:alkylation response protein AidB-like acyl-CoA dehydrogenase